MRTISHHQHTRTHTHTATVIIATSSIVRHQNKTQKKSNAIYYVLCIYQYSHHIQSSVRASFGPMSIVLCFVCVVCSYRSEIAPERHKVLTSDHTFVQHFFFALFACPPPNQPYRLHYTHKRNCVLFQWKRIFITYINHVIAIIWLRFIADTAARNCVYNILLMRLQSKLSIDYNVFGRNSALFFLSRFFLSLVCFWNWKWCHRIRTDVHRHDTRTARQSIRPGHFGNKTMHIYESTVKQAK